MSHASDDLLIHDLVLENEQLRREDLDLWAQIESLSQLLSVALESLSALTKRAKDQEDQIRRLMGQPVDDRWRDQRVDPWYPPEGTASAPEGMVQATEIRWTVE
jgi:hypothetical protein